MIQDGKSLETLVRQIEELLLPQGFSVIGNHRVYNEEGAQIAEFDVEIRGRLGSTDITWLIECRDRPGQGPAPGSWIEQLVGRRDRFGFNKITAVSTTGFTKGATDYANEAGVELRTVERITAKEVTGWLALNHMQQRIQHTNLNTVKLLVDPNEPIERKEALQRVLRNASGDPLILRSNKTGNVVSASSAFQAAVSNTFGIFNDVESNAPPQPIKLKAIYPEDNDHFVVDTDQSAVRITAILFDGLLSVREFGIPISSITEYRRDEAGKPIAQTATFPVEIQGTQFSPPRVRIVVAPIGF